MIARWSGTTVPTWPIPATAKAVIAIETEELQASSMVDRMPADREAGMVLKG
ncbi:hypothetical protein [Paracoccus sp. T5]|uniref:hypothetical protein n=1 Tax=Paracoccus sp. T5 TaxID=3402161 RepID=UPI003AF7B782